MFNSLMDNEIVEKLGAKDFMQYMRDVGYLYNTQSLKKEYKKLWEKRKSEQNPVYSISAIQDGFLEDFLLCSKEHQELTSLTMEILAEVEKEVKTAEQNLKKTRLKQMMIRQGIQSGMFDNVSLGQLMHGK